MKKLVEYIKYFVERYGFRGLHLALSSKFSEKSNLLKVKPPCIPHSVFIRTHSSDIFTYDQIFRNFEYKVNLSRNPKVILDAGSNVGYAAIYFANQFRNAQIYAIEPETSNFKVLEKNIRRYPNIQSLQGALWFENTDIIIKDSTTSSSAFQVDDYLDKHRDKNLQKVTGYTIDKLMKNLGLEFIDILKMDIEGAEFEVFSDPSLWINRIGVLIVELHDRFRPGCSKKFYNAVKDFDYEFERGESIFCARKDYVIGLGEKSEWEIRTNS